MACDPANHRHIRIPDQFEIIGFQNAFKLRNELYELKKELCSYLLKIFDQFWNEIDEKVRKNFKVSVEQWSEVRKTIQIQSEVRNSILEEIEWRQTSYIKDWIGSKEHTRSVAEAWATSDSSVLAGCFIKKDLLVGNGYKFSFEHCDPAQLLSVYQNYSVLCIDLRRLAGDVRKVRDRFIAHLCKLDGVTSPLYTTNSRTIERFRRYLR